MTASCIGTNTFDICQLPASTLTRTSPHAIVSLDAVIPSHRPRFSLENTGPRFFFQSGPFVTNFPASNAALTPALFCLRNSSLLTNSLLCISRYAA